jgi:hypothetical protein
MEDTGLAFPVLSSAFLFPLPIKQAEHLDFFFSPVLPCNQGRPFDPLLVREGLSGFAVGLLGKSFCLLVEGKLSLALHSCLRCRSKTKSCNHDAKLKNKNTLRLVKRKVMELSNETRECLPPNFL